MALTSRTQVGAPGVPASAVSFGRVSVGKKRRLHVQRILDVPLKEVSGVCLRRERRGAMSLFAIGDRVAEAAWVRLPRNESKVLDWQTCRISRLAGSRLPRHDPQIEAVCADGARRC